ncbi:EF-Tu/IF-2/RF-3 family GTPase, partial [Rickettsia sp. wq]
IIYDLLDDVKAIMSGMLDQIIREQYIGSVEIRQIFNITKIGKIAGSYVTRGIIKKGAGVRLLRDNIVIHEGKLKTLKRFKEEVKEVREGYECGIAFENYEDIREGDTVEVFELIQEKKQL